MSRVEYYEVTIPAGQAESEPAALLGGLLVGVFFPAALDGDLALLVRNPATGGFAQAAALAFEAGKYAALAPADTAGAGEVKLQASQAQSAARSFVLAVR